VCAKAKRLSASRSAALVASRGTLYACKKGKRKPVARLAGPSDGTWVGWAPPYLAAGAFVAAEVATDGDQKCGSIAIAIADVNTGRTRYVSAGPFSQESVHVPECQNTGMTPTALVLNRRGVAAFITPRYPSTEGYDVSRTDGDRLVVLAGGPDICPRSLRITLTSVLWDTCTPHEAPLP
jgi:hypothetical protein